MKWREAEALGLAQAPRMKATYRALRATAWALLALPKCRLDAEAILEASSLREAELAVWEAIEMAEMSQVEAESEAWEALEARDHDAMNQAWRAAGIAGSVVSVTELAADLIVEPSAEAAAEIAADIARASAAVTAFASGDADGVVTGALVATAERELQRTDLEDVSRVRDN